MLKPLDNLPVSAPSRFPASVRIARVLPGLVLALSLAVTYSLWRDSQWAANQRQQIEFDSEVKDIHALITRRLAAYEQVLRGVAGLFTASSEVTRGEFRAYVAALNLKEYYPGLQGVGFSLLIPAQDKARHTAALRRQGFADYDIRPPGERDSYTSIIYLEPFADRNLRAFGYDMFSEPVRRAAMERARDTGTAAISGKVRLVQENDQDVQAGFLMYLPVYRSGTPHDTLAERRANLVGWVYEPFRMDDFMHGIFGRQIERLDIEIYDGSQVAPQALMHDSNHQRASGSGHVPAHASIQTVEIDGAQWTVAVHSRPAFEARAGREKSHLIVIGGTLLSLAFGALTWSLARGRARALRLAEVMNRELIKSEAGFRTLFEQLPAGVAELDPVTGRIRRANAKLAEMLGYGIGELEGKTVIDLTFPEDLPASREVLHQLAAGDVDRVHMEKRYIGPDGRVFWGDVFTTTIPGSGHESDYLIAVITNIDERKRAEERLRQLLTVIEQGPVSVVITDLKAQIVYANPRFSQITGYGPDEVLGENPRLLQSGQTPKAVYTEMWATLTSGGVWRGELVNRKKSGEIYWEEAHISPVRNDAGIITHYAAVKLDITGRKHAERQEQARNRIFELIAGDHTLPEILAWVVKYLEWTNDRLLCLILLTDAEGHRSRVGAAPSLPVSYVETVDSLASGAGLFREAFMAVEDIHVHPDWAPLRECAAQAGLVSCWSEPIRSSKGASLGVLMVYQRQPGLPGTQDIGIIWQAAQLAGIVIERKHVEAELLIAASVYRASSEAILVTDAASRIVAVNPAFTLLTGYTLPEVVGQNPRLLSSGRQDEAFYQALWQMLATVGHWQGELWDRRKNGEMFAVWATINAIPGKDGEVHRYVALLSDITEKKRGDELVWEQANYDTLTRLPNRRLFRDRLQQEIKKAQRAGCSLALLFIDLDRFKEVNDTLGHAVGDLLLVEAARRLRGCVRETDTVARLGGDEFTVILPGLADMTHATRVAGAIVAALDKPFLLGGERAEVSASVGIALYPADAVEAEDLLRNADQAMYAAKSQGRNGFSYFGRSA